MNVVFLDMDGVLVTRETAQQSRINADRIHEETKKIPKFPEYMVLDTGCVNRLNALTTATKAKIVLSSAWRHGDLNIFNGLVVWLNAQGILAEIIGRTPELVNEQRGKEILTWLKQHPTVKNFVVLDDNSDMDDIKDNFVHTSWEYGFQDKDLQKAYNILGATSVSQG